MIGASKKHDALAQVIVSIQRFGLVLDDLTAIGGEDLSASNPTRREKANRATKVWALLARHGLVYADLEMAAELFPVQPGRRGRGGRAPQQAIENIVEVRKQTFIENIEEFPLSPVCDRGSAASGLPPEEMSDA